MNSIGSPGLMRGLGVAVGDGATVAVGGIGVSVGTAAVCVGWGVGTGFGETHADKIHGTISRQSVNRMWFIGSVTRGRNDLGICLSVSIYLLASMCHLSSKQMG